MSEHNATQGEPACPFCNGLGMTRRVESARRPAYVQCPDCGCLVAAFHWGRRPIEDGLRERVRVLDTALRLALPYLDPHHPCEACHDRTSFADSCGVPCDSYHDIQKDVELIQDVLAGKPVTFPEGGKR